MRVLLFLISFTFFVSSASAQSCAQQLTSILTAAKKQVASQFDKNTPCYNAAIVGRKNGPPGCFPPGALQLYSLLQPHFKKAQGVCKTACKEEQLQEDCNALLGEDHLRHQGIQGILSIIGAEF